MRQLGKTYITLFGNTIEIDSNTIFTINGDHGARSNDV